ncbi:MAG: hypothetical protein GY759_15140 [Chloroflexi bacterium]|nr:hypothetical protein [Chloroflexota bacterium]
MSLLESIADLPEQSVIFHVDQTDLTLANKVLGDKFCLSGGIPNYLLCNGTPDEVRGASKYAIDTAAGEDGYIMDASALIMDDAKIENVEAMIDFTLDYGVYSQSGPTFADLDEIKQVDRPEPKGIPIPEQKRDPGVVVPWEEKKADLPPIQGDEQIARDTWELVDGLGYGFLWVNLTW